MERIMERIGSRSRSINEAQCYNYSIQEVEIGFLDSEASLAYILNSRLAWAAVDPIKNETIKPNKSFTCSH